MKRTTLLVGIIAVAFSILAAGAAIAADEPDAQDVFNGLFKRIESLKQYKLTFDYMKAHPEAKKEKKRVEQRTCMFWYIEPDVIRLDVVDGDDSGSKVVYNARAKKSHVRAKQGMIPAIWLSKDDPRLAGFFVSDWKSDLNEIKEMIEGLEPVMIGGSKVKDSLAWKIEFKGIKHADFDRMDLWVDKENSVLIQYERFKGDASVEKKTWYDIELDAKLKPDDFKI